ncbi:MAG: hypothetical protein E7678_00295 [Ruminococcaceae bacterium]|nr:hypothetical protein [Oscillospiraceae bacterium]
MSQEKIKPENENKNVINDSDVSVAVKKKRFKKSDILVLGVCIIASALIWMYASNLEKKADAEKINPDKIASKEDIEDIKNQVAEDGKKSE